MGTHDPVQLFSRLPSYPARTSLPCADLRKPLLISSQPY